LLRYGDPYGTRGRLTAGRLGAETMLGREWGASHQKRPMRAACEHAKIDPPANFHALRHTYASHAVRASSPMAMRQV